MEKMTTGVPLTNEVNDNDKEWEQATKDSEGLWKELDHKPNFGNEGKDEELEECHDVLISKTGISTWLQFKDNNRSYILDIFDGYDSKNPDDIQACLHYRINGEKTDSFYGTALQMIDKIAELRNIKMEDGKVMSASEFDDIYKGSNNLWDMMEAYVKAENLFTLKDMIEAAEFGLYNAKKADDIDNFLAEYKNKKLNE